MPLKHQILNACHAGHIPEGESGLWHVKKLRLSSPYFVTRSGNKGGETLPAGVWTSLFRYTDATLHTGGELVMHDFPMEVNKHMGFMLRATGRVLITGLGLGCVVRGTLANPRVTKVTVLENSKDVLKLIGAHMPKEDRLDIVYAEAEHWIKSHLADEFDCAWHDVWTDTVQGEPHLQVKHAALMAGLYGRVQFQGAWGFPRGQRQRWAALNVI